MLVMISFTRNHGHIIHQLFVEMYDFTKVLVLLLFAICDCVFSARSAIEFPKKVVGVFNCEECAPSLAASLALSNFQHHSSHPLISQLTYEHIDESNDTAKIITDPRLTNSIIIVRDPQICELLAQIAASRGSILVCYRPPTATTVKNLKSSLGTYLSQPSPKALVPSVYSFIQKLYDLSNEQGSPNSPEVVTTLVLDPHHSYNEVEKILQSHRSDESMQFQTWWLEEKHKFPQQQLCKVHFEVDIVITAVKDTTAIRHLFCEMYRRKWLGNSVFVILLGPIENDWVEEEELPCETHEFLAAAEGHFLLDYQSWDKESKIASEVKYDLMRVFQRNGMNWFQDANTEAPFVYDSVWAILNAVNRSLISSKGTVLNRNTITSKLQTPFEGVTGEFSMNHARFRDGSKATIVINRFKNGSYDAVGKYFNANLSFYPSLAEILHLPRGWNETRLLLKNCKETRKMSKGMWFGLAFVLIIVLIIISFVLFRIWRIWRVQVSSYSVERFK